MPFLKASLALWRRRLRFRARRLALARQHFDGPRIKKWQRLVDIAKDRVALRKRQIAKRSRATTTSPRGVDFIKSFEGYRGHPYRDAVGVWTIGYGHTRGVGPRSTFLTERAATALLAEDLRLIYEPPVKRLGLNLTQGQFDALVSAVYNLGPGVLEPGRSLGSALHRGDMRAAADALLLYDKAGGRTLPGLTRRRQAERRMFLGG